MLFVYFEAGVAVGEEFAYLPGGSHSGVCVCFGGLCAHFLGGEEYASGEFFLHLFGAVGCYVGCVA